MMFFISDIDIFSAMIHRMFHFRIVIRDVKHIRYHDLSSYSWSISGIDNSRSYSIRK